MQSEQNRMERRVERATTRLIDFVPFVAAVSSGAGSCLFFFFPQRTDRQTDIAVQNGMELVTVDGQTVIMTGMTAP
jgi:4-diphosphocytidyl-2C-methyl-D-erythritol kinase